MSENPDFETWQIKVFKPQFAKPDRTFSSTSEILQYMKDLREANVWIFNYFDREKISKVLSGTLSRTETIYELKKILLPMIKHIKEGENDKENLARLKKGLRAIPIKSDFGLTDKEDYWPFIIEALEEAERILTTPSHDRII